jgi:Ca-activated chloride channel family protein
MNARSFEYQLRNTAPPTPDPEARLRARRAALEEFERIHVQHRKPVAPARSGFRGFFGSLASRNAVLGGLASTCVVVIGVSIVLLMPPADREPRLHVPIAIEPQATLPEEKSDTPVAPYVEPRVEAPVEPRAKAPDEQQVQPQRELEKARKRAPASAPAKAGESDANESGSNEPLANALSEEALRLDEVVVTGPRVQEQVYDSPSPILSVEPNVTGGVMAPAPAPPPSPASTSAQNIPDEFSEVSVTGSRIQGRSFRERFSRKDSRAPAQPVKAESESRDKFQHFEINPVKRVTDDPVSTFSVDVDTASYSFVRRQLNENALPQVDAVRVEEMINYFDYSWPVPESRDPPFKSTVTVSDSPWGEGKKLVHIGIKGYALPVRQQSDVNLVLLLDVSGSMNSPDKLPLAQQSMALLLDSLKPTDTVAIVVYAGAAGQVLAPTPVEEKETILRALNSLRPGGSTAGAAGIQLAYQLAEKNFRKNGVNRILLATDGDFNVGITDREQLKGLVQREREKGVFLSVLGFGEGNYRDETAQTLAQNGNGVAAYIDTLSEARKVLVQESTASLFTIAKDVKLQVEFNPATVAEYRLVGYESRSLNREDFNNDKVDAGDVGSGHTVTAIYEITPVGSKAKLVDESRYGTPERAATVERGKTNEYGFLKIRYKLPNGFRSKLLQQPILVNGGVPPALQQDVDFSTAVAGFAQLLRGGQYTGSLNFEDVIEQAQDGLGEDRHGYRAEFVQLVRKAQRAQDGAE